MNVSIVIPNWNGRGLLAEYLPSVISAAEEYRTMSHANAEIVLVDDGSTDDSVEWLKASYVNKFVNIVGLEKNVGFVRAVNKGFEAAQYDLVFLLNSDVRAAPDCIEPLAKQFYDPDVFAVCCRAGRINSKRLDGGGKIGRFERGFWRVFHNYEVIADEAESELISFYGSGGYTMYDRRKWDALGGFQAILSPNYWEDVEICYRAWKRGWKVIYEPQSRVEHLGSASMIKKGRRELNVITERNRLLITWINLHDGAMLAIHIFWLTLKLAGAIFTLDASFLSSFRLAFGKMSKVRALRSIEKRASRITDKNLEQKFSEILDHAGIYPVPTEADEIKFSEMSEKRFKSIRLDHT